MSLNKELLAKPLKVKQRIQETAEAVSLVLEIPPEYKASYRYQTGQFVTFFLNVNGEDLNRSYSLSSSPLVDTDFQVTVKKITGGRGSTFLCEKVKEGDALLTTPPAGTFFKLPEPNQGGKLYLLFAAGSGITPLFSILKTVLQANPANRVQLVYCNRDETSIIYKQKLTDFQNTFAGRLAIQYIFSKAEGRLTEEKIKSLVSYSNVPKTGKHQDNLSREAYLCGPKPFMELIRKTLLNLGLSDPDIRQEDFAMDLHKPKVEVDSAWTLIGPGQIPGQVSEEPEKILAVINGEEVEAVAKSGQTILESLLEAGAQPPYSCMDGACMACMGKITEGRVYQEDPGILMEDNISKHEALTCQAKPLSKIVKVNFDQL